MSKFNLVRIDTAEKLGSDRTEIFFKGCNLKCKWCNLPEARSPYKEMMFHVDTCTGCGICASVCPRKSVTIVDGKAVTDVNKCIVCGECFPYCPGGNREAVGNQYSASYIMDILEKDRAYWGENGGVLLTGGEFLENDDDYLEDFCEDLKDEDINIAVYTTGAAPSYNFQVVTPYVDTFIYRLTTINNDLHKEFTGKKVKDILENFKYVAENGKSMKVSIPVVKGFNEGIDNMKELAGFIMENAGDIPVELIPYEEKGKIKYARVGLTFDGEDLSSPDRDHMESLKVCFSEMGFTHVEVKKSRIGM